MAKNKKAGSKKLDYPWWIETLAAIGAAATIAVIITLFFSVGRRPGRLAPTQAPAVDAPEFLAAVAGTAGSPLRRGGTVHLLNNGVEFFPALFRVLLDSMGALHAPDETIDAMKKAGVRVETFRPLRLGKLTRFHQRNHRRAIVIDGEVGFTGGMAVGDKWLGDADSKEHWRDTMVKVTGPPAASLQSAFAPLWAYASGELHTWSWTASGRSWARPTWTSAPRS